MISISIDHRLYALSPERLANLAEEYLGRPLSTAGGDNDSKVEFGFDDASDAKSFRVALDTSYKRPPAA